MFNSSRVIKEEDVKQTDSRKKAPVRFIRGICDIPTDNSRIDKINPHKNNKGIRIKFKKTRKKVEEEIQIAEKKAYDKGFSEGADQGKREISPTVESLAKLIRELGNLKEEILDRSQKEIIDLAFSIAGKVIHKEVNTTEDVVLSVLKDAMKNMQGKGDIRIRLNPGDYHHIREVTPDFLDSYGDIMIEKDEEISRGGAVIETHSGRVDARLDQQLNNIRESFHDEHGF